MAGRLLSGVLAQEKGTTTRVPPGHVRSVVQVRDNHVDPTIDLARPARRQPPDGLSVAAGESSTMDGPKARSYQGQLWAADEGTDVGRFVSGAGDHEQDMVIGMAGIPRIDDGLLPCGLGQADTVLKSSRRPARNI